MNSIDDFQKIPDGYWDRILKPQRAWWALPLSEIWAYRDLVLLLFRRDIVAVYKQTVLGPIWFFMGPLFTVAVYTLVFGRVARLPSDGVPPPIFYMSGILLWSFFSSNLTAITGSLVQNASLFGKVYFPRLVVPLSILLSSLVKLGIQAIMLASILLYFIFFQNFTWRPSLLLCILPLLLIILAAIALGLGLVFASLSTRYRDLNHLVGFGVLLLMYASPVIYPASFVPESLQQLFSLNPIAPILEGFKAGLFGLDFSNWWGLFYSFCFALGSVLLGLMAFHRVEGKFVDFV
jgi:lipopolysaccharide transport system permease protein